MSRHNNEKHVFSKNGELSPEENDYLITLAENIKKKRKEKKYTQEDLAREIGISVNSLKNYENATYYPNGLTLIKISDLFHMTPNELFGISTSKPKPNDLLSWLSTLLGNIIRQLTDAKTQIDKYL